MHHTLLLDIDFLEPVAYSTGDGGWECNHGDNGNDYFFGHHGN